MMVLLVAVIVPVMMATPAFVRALGMLVATIAGMAAGMRRAAIMARAMMRMLQCIRVEGRGTGVHKAGDRLGRMRFIVYLLELRNWQNCQGPNYGVFLNGS